MPNWSMGYPEPTTGEVIWMRCPYNADLCGADATMTVEDVSDDGVFGLLVCANGHTWRVAKLSEGDTS